VIGGKQPKGHRCARERDAFRRVKEQGKKGRSMIRHWSEKGMKFVSQECCKTSGLAATLEKDKQFLYKKRGVVCEILRGRSERTSLVLKAKTRASKGRKRHRKKGEENGHTGLRMRRGLAAGFGKSRMGIAGTQPTIARVGGRAGSRRRREESLGVVDPLGRMKTA